MLKKTAPVMMMIMMMIITKVMLVMTILMMMSEKVDCRKSNFLVSSGNKIFSIEENGNRSLLYEDPRSIFISMVVDLHDDDVIFWSDMSYVRRGIYEAKLGGHRDGDDDDDVHGADDDDDDGDGARLEITGVEKLSLNPPVDTVYCLAIDPVTNSLYWTDAVQKTVEVYSYKTKFRKIIIFEDLGSPRGITLDLFSGYLFWNDQDYKRIERSKFDGSDRRVIAEDAILPNHMACHKGRLYWTDSHDKVLESTDFHGNDRRVVKNFSRRVTSSHIVGLAITSSSTHDLDNDADGDDNDGKGDDEKEDEYLNDVIAYRGTREKFIVTGFAGLVFMGTINDDNDDVVNGDDDDDDDDDDKEDFEVISLPNQKLYGAVTLRSYKDWKALKNFSNPCQSYCEQLCFVVDKEAKCSCASYGGLTPQGTKCVEPKEVLLFTIGKGGFVAYLPDPDWNLRNRTSLDVYFVAKGVRPTAVAYNPLKKVVYWSDVDVQRIMQTTFDGRETKVVLDALREGGIVDGLVFDSASNLLYFTNVGVVGGTFTWRKVEVIEADDIGRRRTIISRGGMPRALAVDVVNNHVYYTDWGETGSITRSNMNGTEVKVIRSGLDNPNGLLLLHNSIYFIDSHYKNKDKDASLYRMNLNGSGLVKVEQVQLETPFGMTADIGKDIIIISDWGLREIIVSKILEPSSSSSSLSSSSSSLSSLEAHPYLSGPEYIMGLCFTAIQKVSGPSQTRSCHVTCEEGVCLEGGGVCLRSSYNLDLKNISSFIAVTDLTGIKALNLDPQSTDLFPHLYSLLRAPGLTAVAYHRGSRTFYFQDPLENWIRIWSSSRSEKFFRPNEVISSMLFVADTLYWFDQRGHLSVLTLTPEERPGHYSILVKGRVNPRGLREYLGDLYWIEGSGHLRLFKMKLEFPNSPEQVLPECTGGRISWTSIFYLHGGYLYVTEGLMKKAKLFKCALDGSTIPELFTFLDHPNDLYIFDSHLLYSNLVEGTLNLTPLNHQGNGTTRTLIDGLTNPLHIIVHDSQPKEAVCSSKETEQCLNGSCTPLMGRLISCECASGLLYDQGKKGCIDETTPSLQCNYHNATLDHDATIEIDECKSCQCFGKGETIGDSEELQGMVCKTTQCPSLNCEGQETKVKGQCCPICGSPCQAPGFLDCPQKSIFHTLSNDHNYIIDKFKPRTNDCPGTFRNINLTRIPLSNVVQWNGSNIAQVNRVTYVAKAFDSQGQVMTSDCNYTVQLRDETPPTISCPNDVFIATFDSQVHNVRWPIPVVKENSGHFNLRCSHNQGTTFDIGHHKVTYVVMDGAAYETECSFKVIIEKSNDNVTCDVSNVCTVKQVFNGRLNCTCSIGQLNCHVMCDHGYVVSNASSSNFTCDSEGLWRPDDVRDLELTTCVRRVPKTLVYSSRVSLDGACLHQPDPTFTQKHVEYQVTEASKNLLTRNHLKGSIQVEECTGEDLLIEVQLKKKTDDGDDDNDDEIGQDITPIMENVMNDVMEMMKSDSFTFPILPSNSTSTEDVYEFNLEGRRFKSSCEKGEVPDGDECIKCPPGTFWNVSFDNQSQCSPCPDMTFNLQEGMDHCTPCREENVRHVGDAQCLVAAEATSVAQKSSQHLIAALLCVIIIALCLVAVAFFVIRHCRRTGKYALGKDQVQNRELYDYEESDIGTLSHRHIRQQEKDEVLNNSRSKNYHRFENDFENKCKPLMS